MGSHVFAVGIEHDRFAALTTINDKVSVEKSDTYGTCIYLPTLCDHKPAPREGVGPQTIFSCFRHFRSPLKPERAGDLE